jgi:hypothetical protein
MHWLKAYSRIGLRNHIFDLARIIFIPPENRQGSFRIMLKNMYISIFLQ